MFVQKDDDVFVVRSQLTVIRPAIRNFGVWGSKKQMSK